MSAFFYCSLVRIHSATAMKSAGSDQNPPLKSLHADASLTVSKLAKMELETTEALVN
jgi:hypothetical protein